MRVLLILFSFLSMEMDVLAQSSGGFCSQFLKGSDTLKSLHKMDLRLIAVKDNAGTPMAQSDIIYSTDSKVRFQSDLGPSVWKVADLNEWMTLETVINDSEKSLKEVLRISTEKDYCPPGLSPELCRHVRISREIRQKAVMDVFKKKSHGLSDPSFFDLADSFVERDRLTRELHDDQGIFRFQWGSQVDAGFDGLKDWQASQIMTYLTRETLIRHLEVEINGKVFRGRDLSLESRMMIAAYPPLAGLFPIIIDNPIDINEDYVIGDDLSGGVFFINSHVMPLVLGFPNVLSVSLNPKEGAVSAPLETAFYFQVDSEETPEAFSRLLDQSESVKKSLTESIENLAERFSKEFELGKKIGIDLEFDIDESVTLHMNISGVGFSTKLLFTYYLRDHLISLEEKSSSQ